MLSTLHGVPAIDDDTEHEVLSSFMSDQMAGMLKNFQSMSDPVLRDADNLCDLIADLDVSFADLSRKATPYGEEDQGEPMPSVGFHKTTQRYDGYGADHGSINGICDSATGTFGGTAVQKGIKKALCIGINYYGSKVQLAGCINDAHSQKDMLERKFGFRPENIRLLTDDQGPPTLKKATKNDVEAGFAWLLDGARAGDSLFFSYSGHGTQVPNLTGDEPDGKDEAICPADCMDAPFPANLIVDDHINKLMSDVPKGVCLTCVFDCCHSATVADLSVSRDISSFSAPTSGLNAPAHKGRYMSPPSDVVRDLNTRRPSKKKAKTIAHPSMSRKNVWVISGCQDDQTSADATINGKGQGAMTWALLKALDEANYDITYEDLVKMTRATLQRAGYAQTPALSTTSLDRLRCKFLQAPANLEEGY